MLLCSRKTPLSNVKRVRPAFRVDMHEENATCQRETCATFISCCFAPAKCHSETRSVCSLYFVLSCNRESSFRNVLRLQPVHCVVILHHAIVNLTRETFASCVLYSYAPRNGSLKCNTFATCVATFVRKKISWQKESWAFEMCVVLHVARRKRNVSETPSVRQ